MHSFKDSNAASVLYAGDPIWERLYRSAFPTYANSGYIEGEGWAQNGGVDRIITLTSGKTISVEEKVRETDYGDILLEYWSSVDKGNRQNRRKGWIAKDMACDYIAYLVKDTGTCYMLPFHALRLAWKNNRQIWARKYKRVQADNGKYITVSVAVPIKVILSAIMESMIISDVSHLEPQETKIVAVS